MNTQTYLFENSDKIPESVYIDLMNSLKRDFDMNRNKGVPSQVVCKKTELIQRVMERSAHWNDREEVRPT